MIFKQVRTLLISAVIIFAAVSVICCTSCITATLYSQLDDSTLLAVLP